MADSKSSLPLVYSCSGCSRVAQLANQIAVEFHRDGIAEMSCIAGVGGGVKPLVKKAQSGRMIVALDGCVLHCVRRCLAQHQIKARLEYTLTDFGVAKNADAACPDVEVTAIKSRILGDLEGQ